MSKRGYIHRFHLILKKLKSKPYVSYEDLKTYLEHQFEFLQMIDDDLQVGFSKRTLQRDIKEINNLFGIEIMYSSKQKGYFICNDEMENNNFQRMVEAFDLFQSLNLSQDLSQFIYLEKRKPQGTENLYGILHAIKNKYQLKLDYQKFWDDKPTARIIEPYALKEFKNRWYIIAKDLKDETTKTFALDRLTNLEITRKRFTIPKDINIEVQFKYSFGIISPNDQKPQEIVLSFDAHQGKYIKTLPLHDTQEIILDTEGELQIKLKLCITHDFIMELLSFGENVKVLQPKSLINKIKSTNEKAYKQY